MIIVASINCLKFLNNFHNQIISHATIVPPLYSTFMFSNAIVGWFLLLQLIAPLQKESMKSLVNLMFKMLSTQSTFLYPYTYS